MKQDFLESHAHVLRVTADAIICQQNFDSVANCFFFRKEAYYLEENAKIFVFTNSFIHPCQCLHKMMIEIPLNKIEI